MKQITKHIDTITAILMAAAAVLTAWATYEGSQWDSVAADNRSRSAILRADAGRASSDAVTQSVVDASVWLEWEKAVVLNRDDFAGFLRDRFSTSLDTAQQDWLKKEALDADGNPTDNTLPKGTPLDLDSYVPTGRTRAELLAQTAEERLAEADQASETSSRYVIQAVLLAMVLFFGSAAARFGSPKIQAAMSITAAGLLIISAIRIFLLPIA